MIDAVESGTRDDLREELGDLLWQVLFHAAIAAQDPDDPFDIDDVAATLTEKMVRRHPHVFGDEVATTPEEVLIHWNAAKAAEKRTRRSVLDGVPRGCRRSPWRRSWSGGPRGGCHGAAEPRRGHSGVRGGGRRRAPGAGRDRARRGWDAERALRERLRLLEDGCAGRRPTDPTRGCRRRPGKMDGWLL